LCEAIGSKFTSQHAKGQAADFEVPGVANIELARWIEANLDYDQLILEFYDPNDPAAGWIHWGRMSDRGKTGRGP
jgi:zinc D-Ala-D-Ala carboxypeptidase